MAEALHAHEVQAKGISNWESSLAATLPLTCILTDFEVYWLEMEKMFLPVRVKGEDVIIDYAGKDIVFPNIENDPDKKLPQVAMITVYLNEEGFLDLERAKTAVIDEKSISESQVSDESRMRDAHPTNMSKTSVRAKVSFTKPIGKDCTLVGFDWGSDEGAVRFVNDFDLNSTGEVLAFGTESKNHIFGWAVYDEFHGEVGDTVDLKPTPSSH